MSLTVVPSGRVLPALGLGAAGQEPLAQDFLAVLLATLAMTVPELESRVSAGAAGEAGDAGLETRDASRPAETGQGPPGLAWLAALETSTLHQVEPLVMADGSPEADAVPAEAGQPSGAVDSLPENQAGPSDDLLHVLLAALLHQSPARDDLQAIGALPTGAAPIGAAVVQAGQAAGRSSWRAMAPAGLPAVPGQTGEAAVPGEAEGDPWTDGPTLPPRDESTPTERRVVNNSGQAGLFPQVVDDLLAGVSGGASRPPVPPEAGERQADGSPVDQPDAATADQVGEVLTAALDEGAPTAGVPARAAMAPEVISVTDVPADRRPAHLAERLADSIVRHARLVSDSQGTSFHLQLDPPSLGRLDVRITAVEHGVTISVVADRADGQQTLQASLAELTRAIGQRGITVQQVDIGLSGSGSGTSSGQHHHTWPGADPRAFRWGPAVAPLADDSGDEHRRMAGPWTIDLRI